MGDMEAEAKMETKEEVVEAEKKDALPPLSPQDFTIYNRMAEHMDMFHSNFRRSWSLLSTACDQQKRPQGMSPRQFLSLISQFCHHLTIHHTIEEEHIFPVLAQRMEFFKPHSRAITDHEVIHKGVDALERWVREVGTGEREWDWDSLREVMEGGQFGEILWRHLDEEVEMLGAGNMRLYWSKEEMGRMPM